MIDEAVYRRCVKLAGAAGGQELILGEVVGALLHGCRSVSLPFSEACDTLVKELMAHHVTLDLTYKGQIGTLYCDALYFGTPTIVNDRPLFGGYEGWTKTAERAWVRAMVRGAPTRAWKRIVCGLGSGDISLEERLEDLGGGRVVCFKDFGDFTDHVIVRDL